MRAFRTCVFKYLQTHIAISLNTASRFRIRAMGILQLGVQKGDGLLRHAFVRNWLMHFLQSSLHSFQLCNGWNLQSMLTPKAKRRLPIPVQTSKQVHRTPNQITHHRMVEKCETPRECKLAQFDFPPEHLYNNEINSWFIFILRLVPMQEGCRGVAA